MDDLLPYYERELGAFREACRELAEQAPALADMLGGAALSQADPFVERLIQANALLAARIQKRLDADFPLFTQTLLGMLEPALMRQFVPCMIVQLRGKEIAIAARTGITSIPESGVRCRFETVYPVEQGAATITSVRFDGLGGPRLPEFPRQASSRITFRFEAGDLRQPSPRLRLFLDAEPSLCAAVRDALFLHCCGAWVQPDGETPAVRLERVPIHLVGFEAEDMLTPPDPRSHPACVLLAEYFAFPAKFDFIDIDIAALARALPPGRQPFALHIALANATPDSERGRTLAQLSEQHFRPHCSPAVNLARRAAVPITLTHRTADYPLLADVARPECYQIVDIASVALVDKSRSGGKVRVARPFHESRFRAMDGLFWVLRTEAGQRFLRIAVVDHEHHGVPAAGQSLSVEVLCSNGMLPSRLPLSDFEIDGAGGDMRMLRKPTRPLAMHADAGTHWKLLSQLVLTSRSLVEMDAAGLREALALFDLSQTRANRRQIEGVRDLACRSVMEWLRDESGPSLVAGIEVKLTLDTEAFVGTGLALFAQLMERFFALYAPINAFTRLVLLSTAGEELVRCQPRSGWASLA